MFPPIRVSGDCTFEVETFPDCRRRFSRLGVFALIEKSLHIVHFVGKAFIPFQVLQAFPASRLFERHSETLHARLNVCGFHFVETHLDTSLLSVKIHRI
jgi:hypothetical protein